LARSWFFLASVRPQAAHRAEAAVAARSISSDIRHNGLSHRSRARTATPANAFAHGSASWQSSKHCPSRVWRARAHAVLRAAVEQGQVNAVELGGGRTGYQIARSVETAFPAAAAVGGEPAPTATSDPVSGPPPARAAVRADKPRRATADDSPR
jgi:hypothetical protein